MEKNSALLALWEGNPPVTGYDMDDTQNNS